jgi:hypothetical protein
MQAAITICGGCLATRTPLPHEFYLVNAQAAKHVPETWYWKWRWHTVRLRLVKLYTRLLPDRSPILVDDAADIVTRALSLYQDVLSIMRDPMLQCQYEVVKADDAAAYTGYSHRFKDDYHAKLWIAMLTARLMLIDIMRKAVRLGTLHDKLDVSGSKLAQVVTICEDLHEIQTNIFASLTPHLQAAYAQSSEVRTIEQDATSGTYMAAKKRDQEVFGPKPASPVIPVNTPKYQGQLLHWYFYVAGSVNNGSESSEWVIKTLSTLGRQGRRKQALLLAERLRRESGLSGAGRLPLWSEVLNSASEERQCEDSECPRQPNQGGQLSQQSAEICEDY